MISYFREVNFDNQAEYKSIQGYSPAAANCQYLKKLAIETIPPISITETIASILQIAASFSDYTLAEY